MSSSPTSNDEDKDKEHDDEEPVHDPELIEAVKQRNAKLVKSLLKAG
jgi:hypothetical protein